MHNTPTSAHRLENSVVFERVRANTYPQCYTTPEGVTLPRQSSVLALDDRSLGNQIADGRFDAEQLEYIDWTRRLGDEVHKRIALFLETERYKFLRRATRLFAEEEDSETRFAARQCCERFYGWYKTYRPTLVLPPDSPLYSNSLAFAGTPDIVCDLSPRFASKPQLQVVEIKTSERVHTIHKIQLEAYSELLKSLGYPVYSVATLCLRAPDKDMYKVWYPSKSRKERANLFHGYTRDWHELFSGVDLPSTPIELERKAG